MESSKVQKTGLAAAVATALAASICCIGPLAAAFLGLSSLSALVQFETYRPLFTVVTITVLAGAFYLTYRKKPTAACEPGSVCNQQGPGRIERLNRMVLWTVAAIVLIVLTFPTWSAWVF